jgi:hypothetical protein
MKIKNETTVQTNFENTALIACFQLHSELLKDDFFAGYDGSKEQFDSLYAQVYKIVSEELWDGVEVGQVIETFYIYEDEIAQGLREVDWHLF